MEIVEVGSESSLPLLSLNHISLSCRSVWNSVRFYEDTLGFVLIKRPSSFNFNGAWLYNYGIGIHLIENPTIEEIEPIMEPQPINPKDNHISFQCTDIKIVKRRLEELGMRYATSVVEDGGQRVDQVFFHDPDGYMIELCNCENIPIVPLISSDCKLPLPTSSTLTPGSFKAKCGLMENVMMERLSLDMLNFSF
ncbi:hypothetical protein ACFE04_001567 [Oxalis oulophora]